MKRTLMLAVVLLCTTASAAHTQTDVWVKRSYTGSGADVLGVDLVNADTGFAVVGSYVIRTTDAGVTWQVFRPDADVGSWGAVSFPTGQIGYIAGTHVYKTTNGGVTWDSLYRVSYPDGQPTYFVAMDFVDEEFGAGAIANRRYTTTDGGLTWIPGDVMCAPCESVKALDRDAVYFGGWLTSHIGIFGTITISNDEGRRLSSFNNYIIPGGNLQQFALEVYNKTHIWTGGSRWPRSSFTNYLVFTHDSGATWHEPEVQFPSTITAIAFADAQHGLVGDVKGDIYITHDGGYTWTLDYKATEPLKINDIDIYGNTIIAGTDRSQILRRTVPVSVHYPSPPTTLSTYSVYPNPSTGTVHISLDADFSNISVFDILGNVVLNVSSGSLTSNPVTLDLSRFPSGMYRVVVRSDYGMQSESVVKL